MTLGLVIASLMLIPIALLSVSSLSKLKRTVDTLITSDVRQEEAGRQYLLAVEGARRTERTYAFVTDTSYARLALEAGEVLLISADSLVVLLGQDDSLAVLAATLSYRYNETLDTLISVLPAATPKLHQLRRHADHKLSLYRDELDELLREAAQNEEPAFRDSVLREVERHLSRLDLDTLLVDLPQQDPRTGQVEAELDDLFRRMTAVGEIIVEKARNAIDHDFTSIDIAVSRGQRNLLGLLLVTALSLTWWIVYFPRKLYIPLLRFVNLVRRMAAGDFSQVTPEYGYSELDELSSALKALMDHLNKIDGLRTEKVRIHWRRLQLLASNSTDLWCIVDGNGKPILVSAALSAREGGVDECRLPPPDLRATRTHAVDPTAPERGSIIWFEPEARDLEVPI